MELRPIFNTEDIKLAVFEALKEFETKRESSKLLSINAVSKILGKSNKTIKKLVDTGFLKTTKSGLIPKSEVEKYLKNID